MGKPLRAAPTVSVLILAGKLHCADSSPVHILQLTNQFPVIQLRTGQPPADARTHIGITGGKSC